MPSPPEATDHYHFASDEAMYLAIHAFETGDINRFLWRHRHHILATCWLLEKNPNTALDELRAGIHRVNKALGTKDAPTRGYHETITRFWFLVIRQRWQKLSPALPFPSRANIVLNELADRGAMLREHYSDAVLMTPTARVGWVPPDLKPLPPDCPA